MGRSFDMTKDGVDFKRAKPPLSSSKPNIFTSNLSPESLALANLLSIGTLCFRVVDNRSSKIHFLTEEWCRLPTQSLLEDCLSVPNQDFELLDDIYWLIDGFFICARCKLIIPSYVLFVRIYLVPYDLPNVNGFLLTRSETLLAQARKHMKRILSRLSKAIYVWNAEIVDEGKEHFNANSEDNRTLSDIFTDLPSPKIPNLSETYDRDTLEHILESGEVPGMRSTLFSYQRESVAAMVYREEAKSSIFNPLYIELKTLNYQSFYFQPGTMEVRSECPLAYYEKGGMLCEELGTGKTVMILALILCSLNDLPAPEESHTETREVITPIAFRQFPFPKYIYMRNTFMDNSYRRKIATGMPTLVELLMNYIRTSPAAQEQVREYEDRLRSGHLWEPLMNNAPFYFQRDENVFENELSPRKRGRIVKPRTTYLTAATLIIVPSNLLNQWNSEILKHCEIPLRVLVLDSSNKLPDAVYLASRFDIVLMTAQRFSNEASMCNVEKLRTSHPCQCESSGRTRVPLCRCSKFIGVSPLLQVRWKRLVVDEGHNSATISNNLTNFSKMLSVERRWIVTGTPTTNLLGLSFGGSLENDLSFEATESQDNLSATTDSNSSKLEVRRHCQWTKRDREDLRKLSNMMVHFLGVPLFARDPKVFDTHVIAPLMEPDGPYVGAIQVLTQVMSSIMIRHRVGDIEKDVILPPFKHEHILLDMDPYAVKTYNVLLASVVVNAIDSERTDIDYLFHPRNAAILLQVIENLSQTLFWHVDSHIFDWELESLYDRTKHAMENVIERSQSESDLNLVQAALRHLEIAIDHKLWRNLHSVDETPYRLFNLPRLVEDAWALFPRYLDMPFFLTPARILKLRQIVVSKPLISVPRLVDHMEIVREEEAARKAWFQARQMSKKSKARREEDKGGEKTRANEVKRIVESPEKMEELRQAFVAAEQKLQSLFRTDDTNSSTTKENILEAQEHFPSLMLRHSIVADVRISNSTSSKLDYILNEVITHSAKEKFIIFSRLPLTLAHLAEGLALAHVKFVEFRSGVERKKQNMLVSVFETLDSWRVCLMELKYGARGLNIVSASRVIFCEPVWHADVESQAIKRVHRIGQTKPITVKTLAIRSTFEEEMLNRRRALRNGKGKLSGLSDDRGIREFLQNPKFLEEPITLGDTPTLNIPLLPTPALAIEHDRLIDTDITETGCQQKIVAQASADSGSTDHLSKRRKLRFV